jgi:hypothetical protein
MHSRLADLQSARLLFCETDLPAFFVAAIAVREPRAVEPVAAE